MTKQDILNLSSGKDIDILVGGIIFNLNPNENDIDKYSTDIASAWKVIHRMIELNFNYTLSCSEKRHTCAFDNIYSHRRYIVHGETPELVICKAGLLALNK